MIKIGICFPMYDYLNLPFDEFKEYVLKFKENGLYSFDFYTSFILEKKDEIDELFKFLTENNIRITFHYSSKIISEDNILEVYLSDLNELNNILMRNNINYNIPIVFHMLEYSENNKYQHMKRYIEIMKTLCTEVESTNYQILIETLSQNHPKGNIIGDEFSEINLFLNNIDKSNFGICWDTGHTRLNNIEVGSPLLVDKKYFDKIKLTHIHNIYNYKNKFFDHLPFTNLEYQRKEIEYLFANGYDGIYSIEIEVKNLRENIYIYLDSIIKLGNVILEEIK